MSTELKHIFNPARFEHIARELALVSPGFDGRRFLDHALPGLEDLSLLQRLRRMTEALHSCLPANYRKALGSLRLLAPRINHNFVTLVLPDYVSLYGLDHFELSLDALKFFTPFGSSEFGVREFLRRDPERTLARMEEWSRDPDPAVRRLASEGSRPRLPWSFRLDPLIKNPGLALPILENLRTDSSLYVRKSVANHLNDITKDHADWVLDQLQDWPRENVHCAWITKHALRTLIKKGHPRALSLIGAGRPPKVQIQNLQIAPQQIRLGDSVLLSFEITSRWGKAQRLVIDYIVHYVKKSGGSSAKVFKLKTLTLEAGQKVTVERKQSIRDFSTRVHYPGRHAVEIMINGQRQDAGFFELSR